MDRRERELAHDDAVIGDTNLARTFHDAVDRHRERKAQMYKGGVYDRCLTDDVVPLAPDGDFTALTYDDVERVVIGLAAGFRDLGVAPGDRVGIYAHTRMEWAQCDLALLGCGAAVTTVYPGSSEDQLAHLLGDSEATAVVAEDAGLVERVLAVEDDLDLEAIVVMDEIASPSGDGARDGAEEPDWADRDDVYTLDDVYDREAARDREAHLARVDEVALDDLASLVYTSGTTGEPKGVELTHGNVRANVNDVRRRFGPRDDRERDVPVIDEQSRTVSFLPLAHAFERLAGHFLMFASGATVAYAESPDTLREDFRLVRPTTGTSVPRIYEKMYDAIRAEAASSGLRERIFGWASRVGRRYHEAESPGVGLRLQHWLADRLVFAGVREALGGRVEMLISGGGSLAPELATLYHGMGIPILEGYGLTETAPVVSANPPEAPEIGTIGPPLPGVAVHVDETVAADAAADGEERVGELLVRGANVTRGYWGLPDATEAAYTDDVPDAAAEAAEATDRAAGEDGVAIAAADASPRWFRTGDVVALRPDGYLAFRDRAKELLVLSTGKNVAPRPIESAFATSSLVAQCMVIGDGEKFVGALFVPNAAGIRRRAASEDVALPDDDAALAEDERVRAWIDDEVERVNAELEGHETIKRYRLVAEEWTEANGALTPTMKKKRRAILSRHADLVDAIYDDA